MNPDDTYEGLKRELAQDILLLAEQKVSTQRWRDALDRWTDTHMLLLSARSLQDLYMPALGVVAFLVVLKVHWLFPLTLCAIVTAFVMSNERKLRHLKLEKEGWIQVMRAEVERYRETRGSIREDLRDF